MKAIWSPDGTQIAFIEETGLKKDWKSAVHVIGADGQGERRVGLKSSRGPLEWSPDGTGVLAIADQISFLNIGSGEARTIGEGRDAAWSPDGSMVAVVVDPGGRGFRSVLYIVRRDGSGRRQLAELSGRDGPEFGSPVWTPDGQSVLIAESTDYTRAEFLRQIPVNGGPERTIVPDYFDVGAAVSPDGRLLAFSSRTGIETFSLVSGKRTVVIPLPDAIVSALAWSPDGKELGYLAEAVTDNPVEPSRLYVVRLDGSDRRVISKPGESVDSFDWRPEPASG